MKNLVGKCRSALDKYNMISSGDKIAVGISGGKDSLTLLHLLNEIQRYYPKKFELLAITMDPCFLEKSTDFSEVTNYCNNLNIDHIIKKTQLYNIIFKERKETNPCSLCARMRRGLLHNIAIENGCNKVALGHNLDDAVETFFMNLLNCGQIGCFSPKSYLSRKELWLIRPLIFCNENEIRAFAENQKLPIVKSNCPVNGKTERQKTKNFVKSLEKDYCNIQKKIISAITKNDIDDWGKF